MAACGSDAAITSGDGGTAMPGVDSGIPGPGAPDAAGGGDSSIAPSDGGTDADATAAGYGPYGKDGPQTVSTVSLQVTRPGQSAFTVEAYLPASAGLHPVVILSSGFFQNAAGYAAYGQRLASWDIIALLRDDPALAEQTADVVLDVSYEVTTWLAAANADNASALFGKVDVSKIGLAGHSRGGQVSLLAAEGGALGKVKGIFGLDPVDGTPAAKTALGTVGVPVAFVGETTDSMGAQPCAPAADNFQALYQATSNHAVAITAVGADHPMFEDPNNCTLCTLCTAGTAAGAKVRDFSARYLTAFFARELKGDATVGLAFEGAGAALDVAAGATTIVSK